MLCYTHKRPGLRRAISASLLRLEAYFGDAMLCLPHFVALSLYCTLSAHDFRPAHTTSPTNPYNLSLSGLSIRLSSARRFPKCHQYCAKFHFGRKPCPRRVRSKDFCHPNLLPNLWKTTCIRLVGFLLGKSRSAYSMFPPAA